MSEDDTWRLDKHIPLAFLFGILIQTGGAIWWASAVNNTLNDHDRRIVAVESFAKSAALESQRLSEALARLDERLLAQTRLLQDIKEQLGRR